MLAKIRIKSEHCIGILKGRFQCLKRLDVWIKEGKNDVKQAVDLISCACILNNLLLDTVEDIPQSWYDEIYKEVDWDMYDSEHSSCSAMSHNELHEDYDRRTQVFQEIKEFF